MKNPDRQLFECVSWNCRPYFHLNISIHVPFKSNDRKEVIEEKRERDTHTHSNNKKKLYVKYEKENVR